MKFGDQTRTQFGVRVSSNSKVARSLFSGSFPSKIYDSKSKTPDGEDLGSTSEVVKNWSTARILEKEKEENLDVFHLTGNSEAGKVTPSAQPGTLFTPAQGSGGQTRQARVSDIFDQCLKLQQAKKWGEKTVSLSEGKKKKRS